MIEYQSRRAAVVRALLKYPLTAEMLMGASHAWGHPFRSMSRVRETLKSMFDDGYINRQELPLLGQGRSRYLYFLKPKAALIVPEVKAAPRHHALFRGLVEAPYHTLAASEFCAHLERSAGESGGRVEVLATLRPREFTAKVTVTTRAGEDATRLVPDYTQVVAVDGRPRLFFVEIQNNTPLIMPVGADSVTRSFRYKLTRYKSWITRFREDHQVQQLERAFACRFDGFQVLIVTTRGAANMRSLMQASTSRAHDGLFLFTSLDHARAGNVFTQEIWFQSSGKIRSLVA